VFLSRDKVKGAWWLFAILQLFAATSLATLTVLGGSSLTAPQAGVLVLLLAAVFAVWLNDRKVSWDAIGIHAVALAIIAYTLIISFIGPRLFAGKIDVIAIRPDVVDGVAIATPLEPRSGNITQSAYMSGSFLTALAVSLLFARRLKASDFRNAIVGIAVAHTALGVIDWVGITFGFGRVLDFLRNANFSILDQTIGTIVRLSGSLPESSSYAAFGVPFAVFCTEQWVRARDRVAGVAALGLWVLILASTSSTGMFAAAVYAMVALPRFLLGPRRVAPKAVGAIVMAGLALICVAISLVRPDFYWGVRDFVVSMTLEKGASDSGMERTIWSMQGWSTFLASYGLGTGAGSFRSSSQPMAVLGSVGVIGSLLFLIYFAQVGRSTIGRRFNAMQRSAGWAAMFTLVPALATGGSLDPSFAFGIFAGFALHRHYAPRTSEADRELPRYASLAPRRR
jgi:hydrogenase-4 membrane subunit HyfE